MQIRYYITDNGEKPVIQFLDELKDKVGRASIASRIVRVELNLFGDTKFVGDGVWELRIDVGPAYRVYYAQSGKDIVLLLCAGYKRGQAKDIKTAKQYWKNWQKENQIEKNAGKQKRQKKR